jgi:two-component system LytT family response regulator
MSAVLRAMIVDDEAPAREGLRLRLNEAGGVEILGEYSGVGAVLDALRTETPDLIFLDIQMPGLDGFALLERTAQRPPPLIVFVTAHQAHAVRAFDAEAFDYLLKPVEQRRLQETLARSRAHLERVRRGEIADRMQAVLSDLPPPAAARPAPAGAAAPTRIPVKRDGAVRFLNPDEIDYIDAAGDSVRVHIGRTEHVVHRSLGEMLALLDPGRFAQIHRSTIVNVDRIRELQPYFHGEYVVVLTSGVKLKLSRGHRPALAQRLGIRNG